jgi:hypothetical protein
MHVVVVVNNYPQQACALRTSGDFTGSDLCEALQKMNYFSDISDRD